MRCVLSAAAGIGTGALLLMLLLPFSAHAMKEGANVRLAGVKKPLSDLEFDQELQRKVEQPFQDTKHEPALHAVEQLQKGPLTEAQEVLVWIYEGILSYEMGDAPRGERAFRRALSRQCTAKPRIKVSNKITKELERIRREFEPCPQPQPQPPSALRKFALIPAIAGGALVVAGGGFYAASRWDVHRLRSSDPGISSRQDAHEIAYHGKTLQALGGGLLGLGAAGLATSAVMYLLGPPQKAPVTFGVGTDGTSAFVYGRWP